MCFVLAVSWTPLWWELSSLLHWCWMVISPYHDIWLPLCHYIDEDHHFVIISLQHLSTYFSCIRFRRNAWWFNAEFLMLMLTLMLMFLLPGLTKLLDACTLMLLLMFIMTRFGRTVWCCTPLTDSPPSSSTPSPPSLFMSSGFRLSIATWSDLSLALFV